MIIKLNNYIFELDEKYTEKINSKIKIKTVTTLKDFKIFYKLQWKIYDNDENWIPSLWQELKDFFKTKNVFWKHAKARLFIAYEKNEPVGRIAAIYDDLFIEQEKQKIGYFGFYECINDLNVSKALLDLSKKWLKKNKIKVMRGPIDGRVDNRCGFLINGFESPPFIFSSFNPKYYNDLVKKYGMKKSRDLLLYWLDLQIPIPDYLKKASERIKEKGYKIRGFNKLKARTEINWFIKSMLKTFSFHWGYINAPAEEIRNRFGLKYARWIADSGLFLIAESKNGKKIAFKWSTPNYNQLIKKFNGKFGLIEIIKFLILQRNITEGRFNFVGIDKEHRGQGLGSAMNYWTMLEMKKRGYTGAECGWIDEKNIASQKTIEKTGAKYYKKLRVYEIKI